MSQPRLSVVIPAYNEEVRFKKTLPVVIKYFNNHNYSCEIIIANDGSTDGTTKLVKELAKKHTFLKLIDLQPNLGKGAALRRGIASTKGEWVLFMDADLSTPLEELDAFWQYTKSFDIVIGSRKMRGAHITQHQNPIRENLGKIYTFLTNRMVTKGLSDVTCGFKLFEGKKARKIFGLGLVNDFSFDAEILFLAQKFGYSIKEVPVKWHNDPRTKVNMLNDGVRAFQSLLRIRVNDMSGKYK